MLGAIVGDVIGSVYEAKPIKTTRFPLFHPLCRATDDSVLTVALAEHLLRGEPYAELMKRYFRAHPNAGYGGMFIKWASMDRPEPYNSWGNGSAMRTSPVGYAFETMDETLAAAKAGAEVTHDHPEGIKGAQAISAAVYLARTGRDKDAIKEYVESRFAYNLDRSLDEIRPTYGFEVSCRHSVPQAIRAFLESTDFESAVRLAISLGGTATPSPAWPGRSPSPSTAASPNRSAAASSRSSTTTSRPSRGSSPNASPARDERSGAEWSRRFTLAIHTSNPATASALLGRGILKRGGKRPSGRLKDERREPK